MNQIKTVERAPARAHHEATQRVLHSLRRPFFQAEWEPSADNNENLRLLAARCWMLAVLRNDEQRAEMLRQAAAQAMRTAEVDFHRAIQAVAEERQRQRDLFAAGKHSFRCDSPVVDERRKLRVLIEELGECAEALDRMEALPASRLARQDWHDELIQVAAVCVAWLEASAAQGT